MGYSSADEVAETARKNFITGMDDDLNAAQAEWNRTRRALPVAQAAAPKAQTTSKASTPPSGSAQGALQQPGANAHLGQGTDAISALRCLEFVLANSQTAVRGNC